MLRRLVVVALLVLGLGACRVDATLAVRTNDDGSGAVSVRVRLDRDATAALLAGAATPDERVRLDNLRAVGWNVVWDLDERDPPEFAVLTVRHGFATPAEANRLLRQLGGAHGPVRRVRLERDVGPVRSEYRFRALADLEELDAGIAADPELAASLTAQRLDPATLDADFAGRIREALRLVVTAELPGATTRRWVIRPGVRKLLVTSSSTLDGARVAWIVAGVALGVGALLVVVVGSRRNRRARVSPPSSA